MELIVDEGRLFNGSKILGDIALSDDGYWQFWPLQNHGYWSAHFLRAIADKLDEMNLEWAQQVAKELIRE